MPVCRQCGKHFPNLVTVDGRVRNLQRRKFCLACSPFGGHNTSALGPKESAKIQEIGILCSCERCGREYIYRSGSGRSRRKCPSCQVTEKRLEYRDRAIDMKGGKCLVCGYHTCRETLDFHHLNPEDKEFEIGDGITRSWEKIKKEADKCVLLCRNCHGEAHANLISKEELIRRETERQLLALKDLGA